LTGELASLTSPPAPAQKGKTQDALSNQFFDLDTYPNPFNPSTNLCYSLPERAQVTLAIYDVLGRQLAVLAKGDIGAGRHEVVWNAEGRSTGVYYARLVATSDVGKVLCNKTNRLLLVK
jgi:hypothetical protein